MSERDDNSPKPLPDDFGMTMPSIRQPKQQPPNAENLDMTMPNLRLPNQSAQQPPAPPPDDFGMTIPNIQRGGGGSSNAPRSLPPDDFDLTAPNIRREPPSDADFGLTMPGTGGGGGYGYSNRQEEQDFGATMPYIKLPESERRQYQEAHVPVAAPPQKEEKRKGGVPVWLWAVSGSLVFLAFLLVAGVAAWYFLWHQTGFALVVKDAPAGSSVFVDERLCGERSGNDIKCSGLKAGEKRNLRVSFPGHTDFTKTIEGKNGEELEVTAIMPKVATQTTVQPQQPCESEDPDPRVAEAECRALAELDKLMPPFTVDDLVRVLNMQIINFESNKFDIPARRERFLRKAADKFKQLQGSPVVEIGGHTDNVGGADRNLILSQNRANAVRFFLIGSGVSPSMLTTKGYGATKPKTENTTENGKFQNRRIEYTVVSR